MNSKYLLLSGVALVGLFGAVNPVFAQGTAFVYQGRLNDGANPASGSYDLRFAIYDAGSNGNVIGMPITNAPTGATNGLFTVTLDFGSGVFTGPARWLEIGVRTNGSTGPYSTLLPRQPLAAAPYAITAANVVGLQIQPNAGSGAPNFIGGSVVNYIAPGIVGSVIDGGGATNFAGPGNTSSNSIAGNFGVVGGGQNNNIATGGDYNAIGGGVNNLIDNSAYSAVAGGKANTIQSGASYSAIGGGIGNVASGIGSFIGGGGYDGTTYAGNTNGGDASVISGGLGNAIETVSLDSTIGGGYQNLIETHANGTTIGGGTGNVIEFHSAATTIAGGYGNHVGTHVGSSTVGGGAYNSIYAEAATISGGLQNGIEAGAQESAIGGGTGNLISGSGSFIGGGGYDGLTYAGNTNAGNASVIGGGYVNTIQSGANQSTIGGGFSNIVSGSAGTVPGGDGNTAAANSFAAGHRAKANHTGSFVWADSTNADFADTGNNQFDVRAGGGVLFTTGSGGSNQSVSWTPGAGSWSFTSDRAAKENFKPADTRQILEKVAQIPLMEWNYIGYSDLHVGPMAQDFHAAFPFNENDKLLNSADVAGVSLAAIQGLNQKLEEKEARIKELEERLSRLEKVLSKGKEQ